MDPTEPAEQVQKTVMVKRRTPRKTKSEATMIERLAAEQPEMVQDILRSTAEERAQRNGGKKWEKKGENGTRRKHQQTVDMSSAPQTKRKRNRKPNAQLLENKQIQRAMRQMGIAVKGLGPNAAEIFKTATLQVVQTKLQEVYALLSLIAAPSQTVAAPQYYSPPVAPTPQAPQPMTLENIDRVIGEQDRRVRQAVGPYGTCQICGLPAVVKNSRGMTGCTAHAPMVLDDDANAAKIKLQSMMQKGFGRPAEDVIAYQGSVPSEGE
jgi:hypothetical protein